jgi:hypothetical protein
MSRIWLSVILGVVALLWLPGTSSAQHRGMRGGGFMHGSGFHPGFNRPMFDPRFGRFDRDFDRRFIDPRFDQRFFAPRFNSPFFDPRSPRPLGGPGPRR